MEEVFERLSDMYSIEVQAMPPVLAHLAIPCCAERGGICSYSASISTAANHSKSNYQSEHTQCGDARADEPRWS